MNVEAQALEILIGKPPVGLLGSVLTLTNQFKDLDVEQAREKYFGAASYPRKTKKRIKKEALADFNFWNSIDNWHNEFLNGKLIF